MADPSRTAALALRLLLAVAVTATVSGVVLGAAPAARVLRLVGLWSIVSAPFIVLVIVSARTQRTRWFAAGTLALAVIGFLLA